MPQPTTVTYSVASGLPIYGGRYAGGLFAGAVQLEDVTVGGGMASTPSALAGGAQLQDATAASTLAGFNPPAWLTGKSVGQWFQIAGTTHAGSPAAPGDALDAGSASNKRLAYSNMATDLGTRLILAATGGHGDYSGNQVTAIDLAADAPTWSLLHAIGTGFVSDAEFYTDGTPNAAHRYNSAIWSTTDNVLRLHGQRYVASSGVPFAGHDITFNLSTNSWASVAKTVQYALCRDSHDACWAIDTYFGLFRRDPTTGLWSRKSGADFANGIPNIMAHDSLRDTLFQVAAGDNFGLSGPVVAYRYDMAATAQTPITFDSGSASAVAAMQATGAQNATLHYIPALDKFFWYADDSNNIWVITPNSGTVWSMSIMSTTGTPPQAVADGAFGRLQHIPSLKVVVSMPTGYTPLVALRYA